VSDLDPAPAALAELLVRTTELPWPTTEGERLTFFAALGLHDGGEAPRSSTEVAERRSRWFTSDLSTALRGVASTFRGEFLGLGLFAYDEPADDGPLARAGYAGLRSELSRHLGPPVEEWGTVEAPACLWRPGELVLDLYCFQRLRSGIMVGPAHAARSDALDAAAERVDRRPGGEP
jgi:hypothetical protein